MSHGFQFACETVVPTEIRLVKKFYEFTGIGCAPACTVVVGPFSCVTGIGCGMFDEIAALVEELEALGVKFTVVPRLDGSLRLNTWRMQNAWPNRHRIDHLLAERIESAPYVAAEIAALVSRRSVRPVANPPAE